MTPAPRPLTAATLGDLPAAVSVPGYDRSALVPAVVHIGVGGFHRAHQAVYLDDLARCGESGWGLVGVGLLRPQMGEVLDAQDGLYLVVERSAEVDRARVVGSMTRYVFAPQDPEALLAVLADERTRLVTLTITSSGYRLDLHTGEFDADDELVASDLDDPSHPETVFGYLVEALHRRRRSGAGPFTVLSCDNMRSNGTAARTAVTSFARLRDPDLAAWIEDRVSFPSSMVDRITPSTTAAERDAIAAATGVDDRWPVITEPFSEWVVEDDFCNGRPPLEQVGVRFVPDVAPYEVAKTRLLNAGHVALGHLGGLAGMRTVDEVVADDVFRAYLVALMCREIAPSLPPVPGVDLEAYQRTLVERLANPRMGDQLARLRRRSASKIPLHVLPSVQAGLDAGRPVRLLALAVAAWLHHLRVGDHGGHGAHGSHGSASEGPVVARLTALAQAGDGDVRPLLAERRVFGDLGLDLRFTGAVQEALDLLERCGPREAISHHLTHDGEEAA